MATHTLDPAPKLRSDDLATANSSGVTKTTGRKQVLHDLKEESERLWDQWGNKLVPDHPHNNGRSSTLPALQTNRFRNEGFLGEVPSLKEQAALEVLEANRRMVEQWRLFGGDGDGSDGDEGFGGPSSGSKRMSAGRTGAAIPGGDPAMVMSRTSTRDPEEGRWIEPVSEAVSVRENRLQEDQPYYDFGADHIDEIDKELALVPRHWHNTPMFPYSVSTRTQPPSAKDAMRKFNELADNYSLVSATATWGSRRRSEPSLADSESLAGGSFFRRLSTKTGKNKLATAGFLKDSYGRLRDIVRKKSNGIMFKRNRSEQQVKNREKESVESLAPPPRSPSPKRMRPVYSHLNTFTDSLHVQNSGSASNGSVSASFATSPEYPVRTLNVTKSSLQGLANMWDKSGGPPLVTLAQEAHLADPAPKNEDTKNEHVALKNSDCDAKDEDDDGLSDGDEDIDFDQEAIPISPTFRGFREHVQQLNPMMDSSYLVDRIAHQQVVRYKTLLGWRVNHNGAIQDKNCGSGIQCIALREAVTHSDKAEPSGAISHTNSSLRLHLSDDDSNHEDFIGPESLPSGIPMPRTSTFPAEFECQLCFRIKKFQNPSDWIKHVHEDVQPFTCTFANCREPKSFKRKADWARHENERHRHLEWWTCQVDDCRHKCYRKDNFLQHLVREHKLPEPKFKTKAAIKKSRGGLDEQIWTMMQQCQHETTNKPQDDPCKFCGKRFPSWKKLTYHLARHMEHISLPVLELVKKQAVDTNTIISPVEPLHPYRNPSPVTPTNVDNQRLSSFYAAPHDNINSQYFQPRYLDLSSTKSFGYHQRPSSIWVAPYYNSNNQYFNPTGRGLSNTSSYGDQSYDSGYASNMQPVISKHDDYESFDILGPNLREDQIPITHVETVLNSSTTSLKASPRNRQETKDSFRMENSKKSVSESELGDEAERNKTLSTKLFQDRSTEDSVYSSSTPAYHLLGVSSKTTEPKGNEIGSAESNISLLGLGKASPYSSQSQDGESESVYESETESNEDNYQFVKGQCDFLLRSNFNKRKKEFFVEIMKEFWNKYNKDFRTIVIGCLESVVTCGSDRSGTNSGEQSQSISSTVAPSTATNSFGSSCKRKVVDDDDLPPDDRKRSPQQPRRNPAPAADENTLKFACPFRKHNPRKYNMHNPKFKGCATTMWPNVARTKAHLYRRHMAAIRCVRCWLFFKCQEDLDGHLSVAVSNMCENRDGPRPIDGITATMEKSLKSRKQLAQTEEGRWRDMYKILFPDEEIPSPFFEPVQDDPSQPHEWVDFSVEEIMRQEVPQEFIRRLEIAVRDMDLDHESGLLDGQGCLRDCYATLMARLIRESQDATSNKHRLNSLPTPASSAIGAAVGSFHTLPYTTDTVPHPGNSSATKTNLLNPSTTQMSLLMDNRTIQPGVNTPDHQVPPTDRGMYNTIEEVDQLEFPSNPLLQPPSFRFSGDISARLESDPSLALDIQHQDSDLEFNAGQSDTYENILNLNQMMDMNEVQFHIPEQQHYDQYTQRGINLERDNEAQNSTQQHQTDHSQNDTMYPVYYSKK